VENDVRLFVAVTDYDWFRVHATQSAVEEVNFWQPSPDSTFKALSSGEPLLFKLHSPRNFIVGGGFFAKFVQLPLSLAWDAFGIGNGVYSLDEARRRISKYRRVPIGPQEDPNIGCIVLAEPFFFPEDLWIPVPSDFSLNIVRGKGYDTDDAVGQDLWREVVERLAQCSVHSNDESSETKSIVEASRFGNPITVLPRLGQGAFRVLVTDAYGRRCAFTRERTLPVLEAAHIRPYSSGGKHELSNGLLLRSDVHKLFDLGYMTVDPATRQVLVSRRIKEEFENGRDYYALHGTVLQNPNDPIALPSLENLTFHSESVFRG
jgi:putative restriction endonuclease